MWQIINNSKCLRDKEKGELIMLLNNQNIRYAVTEVLSEI